MDTLTAMKGVALGKTGKKPAVALSKRAGLMPRSAIREIMSLAAGRSDVIHLEVGEPDFGTPSAIIEQAFAAVRQGATRYSGNAGRPSLRTAIAQRASRYGVTVTPERVIVTVGGQSSAASTGESASCPCCSLILGVARTEVHVQSVPFAC